MHNDGDRLRQFAQTHDESCFGEVVRQHIGFVYAVSLRRVRDPHLAQEATQSVFVALARKAAYVAEGPSVIGWLHRSACYETRNLLRAQTNRVARETEAQRLGTATAENERSVDLAALEPVLDEALHELSSADREAILARYFSGHSYAEIGAALRLNENTARMRVERALTKLRVHLQRRGITSSATALALALPACASVAVPAGLVATISTASLAGLTTGVTLAGFLASMSTTKIAVAAGALTVIAGFVYQYHQTATLETTLAGLRKERSASSRQIADLEQQITSLKRTLSQQSTTMPASTVVAAKTGAATPVAATRPETPGITRRPPPGWKKNGTKSDSYDVGVDSLTTWGDMPSAYVASIGRVDSGFGGAMQTIAADNFKNQRVKLTGWVKTQDADNGGHLWLRVDGESRVLQFDNMDGRAPTGTTDWQEYSLVLDVPADSSTLNYGFFVAGSGKMWVNGLTITPVGTDTSSTNMAGKSPTLPKAPENLGFAPPLKP